MNLDNKKIVIVGMGQTALALARLVVKKGGVPFVSELKPRDACANAADALDLEGIPYECGGHTVSVFTQADLIVPSPGVSPKIEPILRAQESGVNVMGEMELASQFCRSKILAVTGTNGKTTTTSLLAAMVAASGESVLLAGNNACPFSQVILLEPAPEYIILEVSSYQLETSTTFHPWIAAILNITPDHLARHGDMEAYIAAKARIFHMQGDGDFAIYNADDPIVAQVAVDSPAEHHVSFSTLRESDRDPWLDGETIRMGEEALIHREEIPLPGNHNVQNILAALAMSHCAGFPQGKVLNALRTFPGVEHRIEKVAEIDGVVYYNDSKSTNVDSLRVALQSFDAPIVLIAGGEGKGASYESLNDLIARHVRDVILIGTDAPLMGYAWKEQTSCHPATTLGDAVEQARVLAEPGDIVLLSPGCASFDMFDNFEHRGHLFKNHVHELAQDTAGA